MKTLARQLGYGMIVWAVPYATSLTMIPLIQRDPMFFGTIMIVEGRRIRSRLLSPREAARLMGVPDSYPLPANYNEAYHLFGDGVAGPVVCWLSRNLLSPIAEATRVTKAA